MHPRKSSPIACGAAIAIALGMLAGRTQGADLSLPRDQDPRAAEISIGKSDGTVNIPFKVWPVNPRKKYRNSAAKITPETLRAQDEKEAQLQQERLQAVRDQMQARDRFDSELRAKQEEAADLQQGLRKIRVENLFENMPGMLAPLFFFGALTIAGILLYLLPSHVGRNKQEARAIFLLNLTAGWTIVGWIVALAWACSKDPERDSELAHRRRFVSADSLIGLPE